MNRRGFLKSIVAAVTLGSTALELLNQEVSASGFMSADDFRRSLGIELNSSPVGTVGLLAGEGHVIKSDKGWIPCDGRSYSTSNYPLLYDTIGDMYGQRRVPDLRGRILGASLG